MKNFAFMVVFFLSSTLLAKAMLPLKLETHVQTLASHIGERNLAHPGTLDKAANYIADTWKSMGLAAELERYTLQGPIFSPFDGDATPANVVTEIKGLEQPDQILVVGAHYDSVYGSPGANDNGSGVASLLELSRLLKERQLRQSVRFVAFANEEPPFFHGPDMGSLVHARQSQKRGDQFFGMISLETIGYYCQKKGCQQYPFPLSLFYPSRGDFVAIVSNYKSRKFAKRFQKAIRSKTDMKFQRASVPAWFAGIDWSDHWSFWQIDCPAIMLTDTAPFRYRHYHQKSDTPDKLDYHALAKLTHALADAVDDLVNRRYP